MLVITTDFELPLVIMLVITNDFDFEVVVPDKI